MAFRRPQKGIVVGFAGADADRVLDGRDEDLAVADLSGPCCRLDGRHRFFCLTGWDTDLDLDLGQETHGVLGAAIDFRVTLLAAVALDLSDGHALKSQVGQCAAHLFELERLYDCGDQFHAGTPSPGSSRNAGMERFLAVDRTHRGAAVAKSDSSPVPDSRVVYI